jgi:hypothetical protein
MSDFEGSATNGVGKVDDDQLTAEELRERAAAALEDSAYIESLAQNTL